MILKSDQIEQMLNSITKGKITFTKPLYCFITREYIKSISNGEKYICSYICNLREYENGRVNIAYINITDKVWDESVYEDYEDDFEWLYITYLREQMKKLKMSNDINDFN